MRRTSPGLLRIVEGLFKAFEILNAYDDRSRSPMLGNDDPTVLPLQTLDDFGQAVLHIGERHVLGR